LSIQIRHIPFGGRALAGIGFSALRTLSFAARCRCAAAGTLAPTINPRMSSPFNRITDLHLQLDRRAA
jgi:hypothetical protein